MYWAGKYRALAVPLRSVHGAAIGIFSATVPLFCTNASVRSIVREIAPKEIAGSIIVLHALSLLLGSQVTYIISYFYTSLSPAQKEPLEALGYYLPAAVALVQLSLFLFVFTEEPPKTLCANLMEPECVAELAKIYCSVPRRSRELAELRDVVEQVRGTKMQLGASRRSISRPRTASSSPSAIVRLRSEASSCSCSDISRAR